MKSVFYNIKNSFLRSFIRYSLPFLILCRIGFNNYVQAQDYVFADLAGIPINTTGWNLQGAAMVGNTLGQPGQGEIILTDPVNNQSGAIFFNTPINLAQCKKWIAEFDFRLFDGNMADGIAFCYLDVPPSGFVSGGGIGIPATANGLKVVMDTWRNCGTDQIPKIQIRWGPGYEECVNQPTRNNNDGAISFIRSNSYQRCRVEYDEGNIRVFLNGTLYLTGFQTFNFTGYFGFTASTGGFNDRHSIKNVKIFTEMPASNAGGDKSICSGGITNIGAPPIPGLFYRWTPTVGLSADSISSPEVKLTNDGEIDADRQYVLETSFADRPGCASRDSVIVRVFANPKPDFSHDTTCLPGGMVRFVNRSRHQGQLTDNLEWDWNFGDPSSGANNLSNVKNPQHFYSQISPFIVTLKVNSSANCTAIIQKAITPVIAPPEPSFTFTGDTCSGYRIQFLPEVKQNPELPLRYLWTFGDGNTQSIQNPVHTFTQSGTFNVSLQVSSPYCTANAAVRPVFIKASPMFSLHDEIRVCRDAPPVVLQIVSVNNGITGKGTYSGSGVQQGIFFPANASVGNNRLNFAFTGNNGCNADTTFNIEVWPLPLVSAGPDQTSLLNLPVQLDGSVGQGSRFIWTPAQFLSNPNILNPFTKPPGDTWFLLSATNEVGCTAEDSVFVRVLPDLNIPNAFSPNGDGINDVWEIRGLSSYPTGKILVFDRYGKQVFQVTGYVRPWDGSFQGKSLPTGVYYYIIDPSYGAPKKQGSVTLIR